MMKMMDMNVFDDDDSDFIISIIILCIILLLLLRMYMYIWFFFLFLFACFQAVNVADVALTHISNTNTQQLREGE